MWSSRNLKSNVESQKLEIKLDAGGRSSTRSPPGQLVEHSSTEKAFEMISEHVRPWKCTSEIFSSKKVTNKHLPQNKCLHEIVQKIVKQHANPVKKLLLYKRYMHQCSSTMTLHHLQEN